MSNMIIDKLEGVKMRFEEIGQQITDPDVINDVKRFVRLNKEYRELEPIIEVLDRYKNIISNLESARQISFTEKDPEMLEMAKMEIDELSAQVEPLEEEIKILMLPVVQERVATKQVFLQETFIACILNIAKTKGGKLK